MSMPTIVIPDNVGPQSSPTDNSPKDSANNTNPTEPTKAEIRKMKLKIDGQEGEYDESEVVKWAQQGKSAAKRFEEAAAAKKEAAEMKKQAEYFLNKLRDPGQLEAILKDPAIGLDVKKWAEDYVWNHLQEEQLTPEERNKRAVEAELKKYREKEAREKAEAEAAQDKALQDHYEQDYEKKILAALQLGGLPTKGKAGREVIRRMANYMSIAAQNNLEVDHQDLVAQVRRDLNEEHRAIYDDAPDDLLEELLGRHKAGQRLRESDIKKLKSTQQQAFSKPNKAQTTSSKPSKLSGQDWRNALTKDFLK